MALNRLLSNLPFNPGLIGQVTFYANRLHKEESVRRIGLVMTALALVIQMFAVIAPAKPTLAAANSNDIVYGGGDKQAILSALQNNTDGLGRTDIRAIFEYYLGGNGAADNAIANGVEETIYSTAANNFWSIGRSARDGNDIALSIPGAQTSIFQRTLQGWNNGGAWRAVKVKSAINSQEMWILKDCGNIVTRGPYQHDSPGPHLDKTAVPAPGSIVKPGQKIDYTLLFGNNGPGNMIGTVIYDRVPAHTTLIRQSNGGHGLNSDTFTDSAPGEIVKWWPTNPEFVWGVDNNNWQAWFSVTVNPDTPDGTKICNNDARLSWIDNGVASNRWLAYAVCHTVIREKCPDGSIKPDNNSCPTPCPYNPNINQDNPACKPPAPKQSVRCEYLNEIQPYTSRTERRFAAKAEAKNGAKILSYSFDYNNDGTGDATIPANADEEVTFNYEFPAEGAEYRSKVRVLATVDGESTVSEEYCSVAVTIPEEPTTPKTPLVAIDKRVRNVTQDIDNAHNTTAKAGDELEYMLITRNIGEVDKLDHTFATEDLNDVLEYADIINLGDGILNNASKVVSWVNADVKTGEEVVKKITVRVKDPVPSTPVAASMPQSFDLKMQNTYGADTTVHVDKPLPKQVENVGKTLPNTGPGAGLALTFCITMITAYFFMRSRILAKELDIVRADYAAGGY